MRKNGIAAQSGLLIHVLIATENMTSTATVTKLRLLGAENFFTKIMAAGRSIMIVAIASRPIHQIVSLFSGENDEKTKFLRLSSSGSGLMPSPTIHFISVTI